jgi:prevent-host-death family protein
MAKYDQVNLISGKRALIRLILIDTWNDWSYTMSMKQIAASKFKEQCLALLDQVGTDGIIITKRGKPVAKLIPIGAESSSLIGSLKGRLTIKDAILSTDV